MPATKKITSTPILQQMIFLFKCKNHRGKTCPNFLALLLLTSILPLGSNPVAVQATSMIGVGFNNSTNTCNLSNCHNGQCVNGSCNCKEGWQGPFCQYCASKVRYVIKIKRSFHAVFAFFICCMISCQYEYHLLLR